jgi:type I restriction enzyme S subunit
MRTYKLKELLSIKNGKDHKGLNNGSIPIFGSGGIMRYGDQSIYNDESILLPRKGTLSNIQYVNKPFWTVDTIYYTKINKELANPFYLFNFLKSLDLSKLNTGTGVPSMTFDSYYNLDIHLPELSTQQKIASVLSALDSKIELNNRINAELEAMAKTLYDYWFVQFDFPVFNKDGTLSGAEGYKSSGGKMVWNEELKREIPEGWEVLDLEKVESNIVTGKTPSTTNPNYYNGNIPFITIGDVRGNMHIVSTLQKLTIDGANQQTNKYIPKGAICVTCIASPGLVGFATEDSQTNQQLNSVVCKNSENRFYLYFYLIDYFKYSNAKTGNTFANMNKGDFSAIQVIKPKKEILISFSNTLKSTVDKILINSQENQKLTELRDWLLPMLMNGQVKVSEL